MCFLAWQNTCNTCQPDPQRTSHSGWMRNSSAQKVQGWLGWEKLGRRFSRPEWKWKECLFHYKHVTQKAAKLPKTHKNISSHPQDMVPYWSATKVNVKVCVAVLYSHQAILLHIWPFKNRLFRPEVLHPWKFSHNLGSLHQIWEPILISKHIN